MYESFNMHSSTVHHPGTCTSSKGIHFSWDPAGDEAHPWVGWRNYCENESGGLWETNQRDFYLEKQLFLFWLVGALCRVFYTSGRMQSAVPVWKLMNMEITLTASKASQYYCSCELLNLTANNVGSNMEIFRGNSGACSPLKSCCQINLREKPYLTEAFQMEMRSFRLHVWRGMAQKGIVRPQEVHAYMHVLSSSPCVAAALFP